MQEKPKPTTEKTAKNELYQHFLDKLNQKESANLKTKLYNFIKDIQSNLLDEPDWPKDIGSFRESFEEECQLLWKENSENVNNNGEAIEAILTKTLYDQIMLSYPQERDTKIDKLLRIFQFIQPAHLELNEDLLLAKTMEHAFAQIQKIDKYKTPRDKVISIINCCKIVSGMISHAQKNQDKPSGADEFLRALIYTIIRAKPQHVYSNLAFIRDFRSLSRLKGMEDEYYKAYRTAIEFIETLNASKLKITPEEYEKLYNQGLLNSEKEESKEPAKPHLENGGTKDNTESKTDGLSDKDSSNQAAEKLILKHVDELKQFVGYESKEAKFYNADLKKLTIAETQELLNEYKKLVALHQNMAEKVGSLINTVDETNPSKKSDSYWKLWKGS